MTQSPERASRLSRGRHRPPPTERSLGSRVGRGALWAVLANITMRFASVAVMAVLARLLSKEDFGVFAVALAVYLVVVQPCRAWHGVGHRPVADGTGRYSADHRLHLDPGQRGLGGAMAAFAPMLALGAGPG